MGNVGCPSCREIDAYHLAAMRAAVPSAFKSLLEDSSFESPILALLDACSVILTDNKMPFFPAYTEHGIAHFTSVLDAGERLITAKVADELLEPADAAVFIGAACLHDLALHLREPGFLALVSDESKFKPLVWFDTEQDSRHADEPWADLWQKFRKESRHFTRSELDRLVGSSSPEVPRIAFGDLDTKPSEWTKGDYLLIGEFIRRHHARLAHEIAMYGFPGISEKEFPVLKNSVPQLADAIGATARSHNEDLRTALEYVEYRANGSPRLDGAVLPYLMGVLRIADYFQIQADRASPLLLHLREPQSPQSVEEWKKHQAISTITWGGDDPLAIYIQASPSGNLRTHLQLTELVDDLQAELDVTTAVLSETYGGSTEEQLKLSHQRVRTNLGATSLHDLLDFVPKRARLRSAEDLFRLVISDLYGDEPAIAGRELLQNAVDAVRELHHWEARTERSPDPGEVRDLPADVLVEVQMLDESGGQLRVIDRGIGMTPSIVIENFLTAGATFASSFDDDENIDLATAVGWMKAGKFGVGAFAAFLLGPEIQVTTRRVTEERGISFVAHIDDDLVQMNWDDEASFGTAITIPFRTTSLPTPAYTSETVPFSRAQLLLEQIESFYALNSPTVRFRLVTPDGVVHQRNSQGNVPTPGKRLPDAWRIVEAPGFDAVLWPAGPRSRARILGSTGYTSQLAHNGVVIQGVSHPYRHDVYQWSDWEAQAALERPSVAVFDTQHQLSVSLNRYQLVERSLPFEEELLRSIGSDMLARALVYGEGRYPLGDDWGLTPVVGPRTWLPFLPSLVDRYVTGDLCVLWTGVTGNSGLAPLFLGMDSKDPSWDVLPFRTAQTADGHDVESDHERHLWGFTENDVTSSVEGIVRKTGMHFVAGVIVRTYGESDQSQSFFDSRRRGFWPPVGDSFASSQTHFDGGPDRVLTGLEEALASHAEKMVGRSEYGSVALTVLSNRAKDAPLEIGPLAIPWADALEGGLGRSRQARQARRAKLAEENRTLRTLINKWDRLKKRKPR